MLAAISTTILSNRSWALTCSAMVSRSRLSKTRGPPDALRMCQHPPPRSQHAGWPVAGVKVEKNNNFIHSAPSQARNIGRIRLAKTVAQFAAAHPQAVYRIEACFAKQNACQRASSAIGKTGVRFCVGARSMLRPLRENSSKPGRDHRAYAAY